MTTQEFKNEFDILYNNIRSNQAPGIDDYELSFLLTKAQNEIVLNTFNMLGNKYQEGFENTEKRRRDLKQLVKSYNTLNISDTEEFSQDEGLYGFKVVAVKIPDNVFFIIQEEFKSADEDKFGVIPITHDEIMLQKDNPYRKPKASSFYKRVWRLDSDIKDTLGNTIELVVPSEKSFGAYKMRYVKKPQPIIITDLNGGEFVGQGLSIEGQTEQSECELDEIIHQQILDRAVSLALEAYGNPQRLQSQTQVSSRNE